MTNQPRAYRRRNILSYPRAQMRIVVVFSLLATVYSVTNYYVGRSALKRVTDSVLQLPLSPDTFRTDVAIIHQQESLTLTLQLGLFTILSLAVLGIGGLYLSHKIAGPIYRIRKYLRGLVDGTQPPGPVRFRKHDFFPELADDFNQFQEKHGIIPPAGGPGAKMSPPPEATR